jgi:hypothetical protein
MRLWRVFAVLCSALFLASVARFYHPGLGFSALLIIGQAPPEHRIPQLNAVPHFEYGPGGEYDGAMYVQIAMVPLLRDPAIDHALDAPSYRARRILFCWTAYLLGLGRPAWIVQAYALQNVLSWLLLAWLITRWFPLTGARSFALWAGTMFSHGLMISTRMSLLDGPSLLLLACAAAAAERGRTLLSAAITGIAALGRETNLLGGLLLRWPNGTRDWLRTIAAVLLIVLPLLVWQDYLWSIYRGTSTAETANQFTLPFAGYLQKWQTTFGGSRMDAGMIVRQTLVLVALSAQAAFVLWTRRWRTPWWRLAAAYALLMLCVNWAVWEGYIGAITRVTLPLKLGFNVLLAREHTRGFWWWAALGNMDLPAAVETMST